MDTLLNIALTASIASLLAGIWKFLKAYPSKHLARKFTIQIKDDLGNEFTSFEVGPEETQHATEELRKVIRGLSSEMAAEGKAARIQ